MTASLSPQQLERLWAEHLKGEFESKDVEATLATMVDDASVNHMPVNTGGRGKDAFLPNVPPTARKITIDVVVVVQFRGDKLACERIYWDHAAALRQAGLLKSD